MSRDSSHVIIVMFMFIIVHVMVHVLMVSFYDTFMSLYDTFMSLLCHFSHVPYDHNILHSPYSPILPCFFSFFIVFSIIDSYAPGFSASVVGRDILSPLDLERTFGLTGGVRLLLFIVCYTNHMQSANISTIISYLQCAIISCISTYVSTIYNHIIHIYYLQPYLPSYLHSYLQLYLPSYLLFYLLYSTTHTNIYAICKLTLEHLSRQHGRQSAPRPPPTQHPRWSRDTHKRPCPMWQWVSPRGGCHGGGGKECGKGGHRRGVVIGHVIMWSCDHVVM